MRIACTTCALLHAYVLAHTRVHNTQTTWTNACTPACVRCAPQAMAGSMAEPDASLTDQLNNVLEAFNFYHGSFERVKAVSPLLPQLKP